MYGVSTIEVSFFFASISHVPATRPSTGNMGGLRRFGRKRSKRCASSTRRLRSSWPRPSASSSGRNRTGAGVSASGRGASGKSNSSLPRSSRKVVSRGRSCSKASFKGVTPDHDASAVGLVGTRMCFRFRGAATRPFSPNQLPVSAAAFLEGEAQIGGVLPEDPRAIRRRGRGPPARPGGGAARGRVTW